MKIFSSYVLKLSVVPAFVVLSACLVNFCRYKAQKALGTEEGLSPKRLVYQRIIDTFKSLLSLLSNSAIGIITVIPTVQLITLF